MALRINNNLAAFNAQRSLNRNTAGLERSLARLASGFRINSAADDAAGLGISERMRAQIRGVEMAQRGVQDGISLVQTGEGALQEISSILQRVRELAVQYNNGTGGASAQAAITAEVAQLSSEVSRLIGAASFNGVALLSGAAGAAITLQVGANQGQSITLGVVNAQASIGTAFTAFTTIASNITNIDTAIGNIANNRSTFGAMQNRLEYTNNSLATYQENMMAAESRIRDVDMADEMTQLTRYQILQESGMAMLAQAHQQNASVLSLLR